ncbi:uncharacterized protein LOC120165794 [Hibiscus syriacus]|uniref:uncharacterized protein LOC120165794 n=1 Tax=Hibiscus syriacus TaxID=106335 RepID=UPI001924CB0F|nr:uncharacterized protein LOC120165794 [Hibiscus syriacus]
MRKGGIAWNMEGVPPISRWQVIANFLDKNTESVFDEEGRNSMEHGGSSSNIEMASDRALDNTNCLSSDSFQEQSGREEMDRFSPRTPYGIANLFREEMKMFSPRSPYGLSSLFSNPNFLDESLKTVFDEKGRNNMEHGESYSNIETVNDRVLDNTNYLSSNSFQGQSGRVPNSGGQLELESMDKEDDGKKAAESTEDDQNNANRKLESLMAKHRVRKLVNMTVDKSVMNTDAILPSYLPPILTAKSNLHVSSNDRCKEILQMPGSAPSFSLPKENPFDLPYDPHEEKPNLMADGEKLRELHGIIKEDSVKVDASGLKKKLKKPNASPSPSEQEVKHVLNSKGTVASHPINKNPEAHEDTKNVDEKVDGLKTSNVPDKLSLENPEKTMHLMEKPITQRDSSIFYSKPSENRANGAEISVEASREMKKPTETIGPGSTEHSHVNLETFYESKTPLESKKKIKGSHPSKYIEKDTRNFEPKHDTGGATNAVQSRDSLIENNVSGSNQRFDGSSSMALNRRLVIEQIPENSFSSPRSVLPENVLEDEMSQSDMKQPQENL